MIKKVLIVLDVYNDYRDEADHTPIEVDKAILFLPPVEGSEIILVGCGFEEFLHESYYSFAKDAIELRKAFCAKLEERLQQVADALIKQGYKVTTIVHWTFPRFEQIAKEAKKHNVDLIVQHVNPHTDIDNQNLSHDSWQLVKVCKQPLLLVKDNKWNAKPVLMAAVDPVHSHHKPLKLDNTILDLANEIAARVEGEVHVVHAYSGSARPFAKPEAIKELHAKAVDELLADYDFQPDHVHMVDEKPVYALVHSQQDLKSDVVIMGAISRSRFSDAVIGNTAERVIDYLKSDVLIVKPSTT